MRYRILGPLQVTNGVRELAVGGGRQRALFAFLLLNANEVVSRDRLVEELWSETAPATATGMVHNHVSSLRKVFAAAGQPALETHGHGYRLRVEPGELDADEFERLVAQGREAREAGRPAEAARLLRQGLALWRGDALADLQLEEFAQAEIARLEDERLSALEDRIEAELEVGRPAADLVGELQGLVARYPLRDRLRAASMLALYRCGRQTDALAVFDDARHTLVETLGLDPGPSLQLLQRRVLEHDPALAPPDAERSDVRPRGEPPVAPDGGAPRRPMHRRLATVAAITLATVSTAAGLRAGSDVDGRADTPVRVRGDSVVAIDPATNRVIDAVRVGHAPSDVVIGGGTVWSLNAETRTLSRIDPTTGTAASFATGREPTGIAAGPSAVWVGSGSSGSRNAHTGAATSQLARISARSRAIELTVDIGRGERASTKRQQIALGPDAVWAIDGGGALTRVDARSGTIVARVPRLTALAVTATATRVVALSADGAVVEISPLRNRVTRRIRPLAETLDALAVGRGSIWVADSTDGVVWRIDTSPELIERRIDVGAGANAVTFGAGAAWVTNSLRGTVTRIDPGSNRVVSTIRLGGVPRAVAVGADAVWVAMSAGPTALSAAVSGNGPAGVAVPSPSCGPVVSGPDGPIERLIVSDLALHGAARRPTTLAMVQAIEFELRQRHFLAGRWHIGFQSCDDSSAERSESAGYDDRLCAANARAYASASRVIGVIGPLQSGCALAQLPVVSRAGLAQISPTSTYDRLTRQDPTAPAGELRRLYPSGRRTFARLTPTSSNEAAADAILVRQLGGRRVWVLSDDEEFGRSMALGFTSAARRLGLDVLGFTRWNPQAPRYRAIAHHIARSNPDAVFLGGRLAPASALMARALRHHLGREPALIAPEFLPISTLFDYAGARVASSLYVSLPGLTNAGLPAEGQRFRADFGATQAGGRVPAPAVYAAQAADVILDAIARSDGTRTSVADQLFAARVDRGLLGTFGFDRNGDTTQHAVTILRPRHGGGTSAILGYEGATIDRVITPTADLLG